WPDGSLTRGAQSVMPEFVTPDIWIRGGLLEAKHRTAMGDAVWLYLHLQSIVRFSGDDAGHTPADQPYRHTEAADRLGMALRTVKYHFHQLEDAGYITVMQRRSHGLDIAITKYGDIAARAASRRKGATERSATPGTSQTPSQVQIPVESSANSGEVKCKNPSSEVPTVALLYKEDKRTNVQTIQEGERERALTPLQLVVNAWLTGINRDPTKAKDYARFTAIGSEMAERGDTPQDVGNCTRYLRTDPWRQEKARMPTLADVRDALPQWIDQGRPAKYRPVPRENGRVAAGPGALLEHLRLEAERKNRRGTSENRTSRDLGTYEIDNRLPG
ncbi:MAG TPA: hypothetical protein VNM48_01330, partial [Chloroflexota bacterium]|nr:hypothetical protein [Chloroflexota bacterium]